MAWKRCPRCDSNRVRVLNKSLSKPGYGCFGIIMIIIFFFLSISVIAGVISSRSLLFLLSIDTLVVIVIYGLNFIYWKNKCEANRKVIARNNATTYLFCKDCEYKFYIED